MDPALLTLLPIHNHKTKYENYFLQKWLWHPSYSKTYEILSKHDNVIENIQIHMPWRVFKFLVWDFAQMLGPLCITPRVYIWIVGKTFLGHNNLALPYYMSVLQWCCATEEFGFLTNSLVMSKIFAIVHKKIPAASRIHMSWWRKRKMAHWLYIWVGGEGEKWHIDCTLNWTEAEYVSAKFCELVTMCLTRCQGKMLI